MRPIEEISEALLKMHRLATGQSTESYMSIPANPKRDADLILGAAIEELRDLRDEVRHWREGHNGRPYRVTGCKACERPFVHDPTVEFSPR